jgi:hypothetical protein
MAKARQLTVEVENRPGTLANLAQVLADAKVNIVAFLSIGTAAGGSVQVVADNAKKAQKALSAAGLSYTKGPLDQVELPNKPGALAKLAAQYAAKNVNIRFAYATTPKGARKAVVMVTTD